MAESFMLVSLKEEKTKKLAQVMSNPTCTKILDYLAKKGSDTEAAIAKKLNIPLSTVHYNLKQLVAAKLLLAEEYTYSKKGREMLHYKLANKYIIIAPAEEKESFLERIRKFIPISLITLGTGAVLKVLSIFNRTVGEGAATESVVLGDAMVKSLPEAAPFRAAPGMAMEAGADMVEEAAILPTNETVHAAAERVLLIQEQPLLSNEVILAFLVGAFFVITILVLWSHFSRRNA